MDASTESSTSANGALTYTVADKIASSTARCALDPEVALSPYIVPQEGYCLAVRALGEKTQYNQVECADGTFRAIQQDDVIVGALGERQALKGYSGHVPRQIEAGDTLNVLNLGGIIGRCTSALPELGPALEVEVLGAVMKPQDRHWMHARIQDGALEPVSTLTQSAPLIVVSGTAMDTGKTMAACQIVQGLTNRGLKVAAAKCTGASLMRDVRRMKEHGAIACVTFTEAGVVSSTDKRMGSLVKGLIHHLNRQQPDVIVLEMGDGFIGYYGVDELLLDKEIQAFTKAHVVAATDLAGVWAADQQFQQRYRAPITAVTGPVTDNEVGRKYIRNRMGIAACNALQEADRLATLIAEALQHESVTSTSSNS